MQADVSGTSEYFIANVNLLPEQQHESLKERAEVVVVIDCCVFIQFNIAKHLKQKHSYGNAFVMSSQHAIHVCLIYQITNCYDASAQRSSASRTCIPMMA